MRIAVHDFAGHPFQFELSRALARRGHVVRHFFFAQDISPKGAASIDPGDAPTFSVDPVSLPSVYSKGNLFQRRSGDITYGRHAAGRIAQFGPDLVISGNTPLDAQDLIQKQVRTAGGVFVFWMQDCHSVAMQRLIGRRWLGLGRLVAEYYRCLERRLLKESDGVVLISEDFREVLARFGVASDKISVIENWGALGSVPVRPKINPWAKTYGLQNKFVFLYSGTLALKHNPERLWTLAKAFERDPDVVVVLVASGVNLEALKIQQKDAAQRNLLVLPLQPIDVFPDVLGAADVAIALLEESAAEFSVPSKILSYLCAGRPILLSAPVSNLGARIVERAGAGRVVPSSDSASFVQRAFELRRDAGERARMGEAGRRYAEDTFDIEAVTDRFEAAFARAVDTDLTPVSHPGITRVRG